MSDRLQTINVHFWQERFSCIGGECPLTCCDAARWGIYIDDEKLEWYKNLNDEFRDEVYSAIDFKGKYFKTREHVYGDKGEFAPRCAMQTDEGLCKLVLKYGDESLCDTCRLYPRNYVFVNDYIEHFVDVTCPVASGYLLDESVPIGFHTYKNAPFVTETKKVDDAVFSVLLETREFLVDLFMNVDGYSPGKCFIMVDIANLIQSVIDKESGDKNFDFIFNKYASEEFIGSVLEEWEKAKEDIFTRTKMLQIAIGLSLDTILLIVSGSKGKLDSIKEYVEKWAKGEDLYEDFLEYTRFVEKFFPKFTDRYMAYRMTTNWINIDLKDFSKRVKLGYYMCVLVEICAMGVFKNNGGSISKEEMSLIINTVERDFFHAQIQIEMASKSIEKIEKDYNYSICMMPV